MSEKHDRAQVSPDPGSESDRGAPPHPHPHAVVVVVLRTDDRHIARRLQTILSVAQTYDEPPNTQASVMAKYVHELTPNDRDALMHLFGKSNIDLLNLYDQYSKPNTLDSF
jgi:hypothetical protein